MEKTLRDEMAMAALSCLANKNPPNMPERTAEDCYKLADAMMAERSKKNQSDVGCEKGI